MLPLPRPSAGTPPVDRDGRAGWGVVVAQPVRECMHHDARHPRDELAVELGYRDRSADLRLVDDPLGVLTRDQLPVGRRLRLREEPHRLARERVEPNVAIEVVGPLADEPEQLHHERRAEELCGAHPLLVEPVEQRAELHAGVVLGKARDAVGGRVALAAQQRQIVAEDVERDALHGPRRAFRRTIPIVGRHTAQQFHQTRPFGSEHPRHVDHRPLRFVRRGACSAASAGGAAASQPSTRRSRSTRVPTTFNWINTAA